MMQPPPYGPPTHVTGQPYAAQPYPAAAQPVNVQVQMNNVIVTQQQVPRWGNMQFLDNMQNVKLTEVKECCNRE